MSVQESQELQAELDSLVESIEKLRQLGYDGIADILVSRVIELAKIIMDLEKNTP